MQRKAGVGGQVGDASCCRAGPLKSPSVRGRAGRRSKGQETGQAPSLSRPGALGTITSPEIGRGPESGGC